MVYWFKATLPTHPRHRIIQIWYDSLLKKSLVMSCKGKNSFPWRGAYANKKLSFGGT